ncbi:odorant binding protein [Diachasma alloeum]|uniref:Odorant binding protein n=1 Tax=Diachasma alloeum TaxID=454923 RepID=A0A4E0RYS4_9HYME|nr:odorant binding protein [Diachasma alloeum]
MKICLNFKHKLRCWAPVKKTCKKNSNYEVFI